MLELLAITTGVELGKFVLEQVLDLSKPVLEGYVQDFFQDCLNSGVARLKASTLKQPMAEAIGFFMQRFIKELEFNDIPDTSINHHYKPAIRRFMRDQAVGAVLGKAFETGCKKIDDSQLETIWTTQYQDSSWQFPTEDFDWRGVAKEYVVQVKGIVKANPELRSLLETDLLTEIAQNTTSLSPGFDVATYRTSLQSSYGYLKLYTLDSTDHADNVRLWRMFIEQTVREALPPIRYDLPLDLKRQLQESGQLETDLSPEALERYRRDYFQQPARKVLEAIADSQHAVVLGDPGAGKSTLLQFLALDWVEGKTEALPLLIELREYALAQSASFLDFLHRGSGADWQFDQQQLHQHLLENSTLVMFDGLDEVFERSTQAAIVDDIIRLAQQYPQTRVLVTSRIIGYNPERFQHANFRQFTLQPLDESEIHELIDRWYDLSMGSDPDKVRLKQRLKDAIANSKAIQTLADNPLLLTMMAILNRRQELPRDRADLYDQASRVLLYHWDVDHKRLQLPMDAIGRREKQEMLRLIAYEMQAGDEGLKGNLISADRLIRLLTGYLRDQGFSEPREQANSLIKQLRERDFILCYRGADTYSFMHRTFLEYFCAVEIVHRFEKQRTLTFEQLRDEVFGQHWQDETWHEVLRLICGLINTNFAENLIDFLMNQKLDYSEYLDKEWLHYTGKPRLEPKGLKYLFLASDCFSEIAKEKSPETSDRLANALKQKILNPEVRLTRATASEILDRLAGSFWRFQNIDWIKQRVHSTESSVVQCAAIMTIADYSHGDLGTLSWLRENIQRNPDWGVRLDATRAIVSYYSHDQDTFPLLRKVSKEDQDWEVRSAAIDGIVKYFLNRTETSELLITIVQTDPFIRKLSWQNNPRLLALQGLCTYRLMEPIHLDMLRDCAAKDPDEKLRQWAQEQLEKLEIQN